MARHILTGVSLALLVLVGVTLAEDSNTQLASHSNPFSSDIAYQFFNTASQLNGELRNITTAESHREYNDDQCQNDIDRVLTGMRNYNEWALKCKHKKIICIY